MPENDSFEVWVRDGMDNLKNEDAPLVGLVNTGA